MGNVTVSFVVPCYKLAHLLPQCINSILSQTYGDFEVLIMDDHSPDNTGVVAKSIHDDRIRYVRNDTNLGAFRNFNKGIGLSRGKYIWLISADDYLRQPYVLERYVEVMEKNPSVGFVFCPAVGVKDGKETEVLPFSVYSDCDRVVAGHDFLKTLLNLCFVVAASAMARRKCYETISMFPLDVVSSGAQIDLTWRGDWYLWCIFALSFDVGYFAEPMVCYREHDLSITNALTRQENIENMVANDIAVPWMVRQKALELGLLKVSEECLHAVAHEYARHCASTQHEWLERVSTSAMSLDAFEDSLCHRTNDESERNWIRARVFAGMGDIFCFRGDRRGAGKFYLRALRKDPMMAKVYIKLILLSLGSPGNYVRRAVLDSKQRTLKQAYDSARDALVRGSS
jgi:glycosyltransferase involved in cell wall biosynthesis